MFAETDVDPDVGVLFEFPPVSDAVFRQKTVKPDVGKFVIYASDSTPDGNPGASVDVLATLLLLIPI